LKINNPIIIPILEKITTLHKIEDNNPIIIEKIKLNELISK
jgi:hypothetical protein